MENVAMDSLARIALFASHGGSNAEAVIDACLEGRIAGRVCLLISDNSTSRALEIAQAHGIAIAHLSSVTHPVPEELDEEVLAALQRAEVLVLVLAGYMKRLGPKTLAAYDDAILNVHPSLLPLHGGVGMYGRRVHEAVLEAVIQPPVSLSISSTAPTTVAVFSPNARYPWSMATRPIPWQHACLRSSTKFSLKLLPRSFETCQFRLGR
jgi:hypothetical protein